MQIYTFLRFSARVLTKKWIPYTFIKIKKRLHYTFIKIKMKFLLAG